MCTGIGVADYGIYVADGIASLSKNGVVQFKIPVVTLAELYRVGMKHHRAERVAADMGGGVAVDAVVFQEPEKKQAEPPSQATPDLYVDLRQINALIDKHQPPDRGAIIAFVKTYWLGA